MTQARFDALVSIAPHFTPEQRQVAALVMIQGRTLAAAGEPIGWSRQRVHHAVQRIERLDDAQRQAEAFQRGHPALPSGWQNVELSGPAELVTKWRREAVGAAASKARKAKKIPDH